MAKLICSSCGAEFPEIWRKSWGKHPATHGIGPEMRCHELVPNGQPLVNGQEPHGICGGTLVRTTGALDPAREKELT